MQSLGEIGNEVRRGLDANGKAQQAVIHAGTGQKLGGGFLVCLLNGIGEQGFHAPQAFRKIDELQSAEHRLRQGSRGYLEGKHTSIACGLPVLERKTRMPGETGVIYLCDGWLSLESMCNFQRIGRLALYPQTEGLDAAQHQPAVEGTQACAL